jgi:hypothetical protein
MEYKFSLSHHKQMLGNRSPFPTNMDDFGHRLGFAWQPVQHFVVRDTAGSSRAFNIRLTQILIVSSFDLTSARETSI